MLNINQKIEELVRTLEESEDDETKNRMRAAMRIGARTAIECLLLESYPTKGDIEKLLKTLDDVHGASPEVKIELIPPAPTRLADVPGLDAGDVQPRGMPAAPIVCSRGNCDDPDCEAAERCLAKPVTTPALADEPSFLR